MIGTDLYFDSPSRSICLVLIQFKPPLDTTQQQLTGYELDSHMTQLQLFEFMCQAHEEKKYLRGYSKLKYMKTNDSFIIVNCKEFISIKKHLTKNVAWSRLNF